MALRVRILNQDDAADLFSLRRRALLDSPLAFLASPEDDLASSEAVVRDLLRPQPDSLVFGAFAPQLVGMLGLHRAKQRKAAHKVNLWGMFVLREHRGQGAGAQLLEAALRHARALDGVKSAHLSVSDPAVSARTLYETAGFETWGVEPDAIQYDGKRVSDYHMRLSLPSES